MRHHAITYLYAHNAPMCMPHHVIIMSMLTTTHVNMNNHAASCQSEIKFLQLRGVTDWAGYALFPGLTPPMGASPFLHRCNWDGPGPVANFGLFIRAWVIYWAPERQAQYRPGPGPGRRPVIRFSSDERVQPTATL